MATRAKVNPNILIWARTSGGFEPQEAAAWLKVAPERLLQWETGKAEPTIGQARELANRYRRPFALFFAHRLPDDPPQIGDFRSLPADQPHDFPPKLRFLIRELRSRQTWAREYREAAEFERLDWVGSVAMNADVDATAHKIRRQLAFAADVFRDIRAPDQALEVWIDVVERIGVFVSQAGDVEPEIARGFCLPDDFAPFILINSKDAQRARIFTLLHELVHLFVGVAGVSNILDPRLARRNNQKIEIFCNAVAAEVLVPREELIAQWRRDGEGETRDRVLLISREFLVSEEVIARRLRDLGEISDPVYRRLRGEYKQAWAKYREERKKQSGGSYYKNHAKRVGHAFTDVVLQARRDGHITTRDVGALLKIKIKGVPKLAAAAGAFFVSDRRSA